MAIAYVQSRAIMDRLDAVVGIDGWQDSYTVLPDGSVECRLEIRIDGTWIQKTDVGVQSKQPGEGDRIKAAYTDALKRTAAKWGIGRYLRRLPPQWCDYDPQKKWFTKTPELPTWARPKKAHGSQTVGLNENGKSATVENPAKKPAVLPATGEEMVQRLQAADAKHANEGLAKQGEFLAYVQKRGKRAGYPDSLSSWSGEQIAMASSWFTEFLLARKNKTITPLQADELRDSWKDKNFSEQWVLEGFQLSRLEDLPECHLLEVKKEIGHAGLKKPVPA
jgi:hypothetical protein